MHNGGLLGGLCISHCRSPSYVNTSNLNTRMYNQTNHISTLNDSLPRSSLQIAPQPRSRTTPHPRGSKGCQLPGGASTCGGATRYSRARGVSRTPRATRGRWPPSMAPRRCTWPPCRATRRFNDGCSATGIRGAARTSGVKVIEERSG